MTSLTEEDVTTRTRNKSHEVRHMIIKTDQELEGMKAASAAVAETLRKMKEYTRVGMSTLEIDEYGNDILKSYGAMSAPQKMYDFPGYNCISVNHVAAHGIPSKDLILKEGDLINIDVSAVLDGFYGDNGGSFVVGEDIHNHRPLIKASQDILKGAIKRITAGVQIAALGAYIENSAKKRGYATIRNLVGHGIGYSLHEEPGEVANFHDKSNKARFRKNTCIALETFISTKAKFVYAGPDGWSMMAKDKSLVTQHEHTLIVTDKAPIILTEANGVFDF